MKRTFLILGIITLLLVSGCENRDRKRYIPKSQNDKTYTQIGGEEKNAKQSEKGYTIDIPEENYRYEKDYDDGAFEEKWERKRSNDVEIKVTTYKNADAETARRRFLREHDDYVFEDLLGYPLCGTEFDGDAMWLYLYESGETIYIVSWEYPKNADETVITELEEITGTFKLCEEETK